MTRAPTIIAALAVAAAASSAWGADCPDGALKKGDAPPAGTRVWCEGDAGARHGPMTAWYPSGEVKVRGWYEHGLKSGKWRYFYEDGSPRSTGAFAAGRMQGVWTWWSADGRPVEEGELSGDLEEGPWVLWHDNGRVAQAGLMREGLREGWWRLWAPDGSFERMVLFQGGDAVDQRPGDSSRYRGYGGTLSCFGYGCASWYRDCYAGFCDPYWDPDYRGYGRSYYGGYPAYRGYGVPPRRPPQPSAPEIPPSGLKPAKKPRKSYAPLEPVPRQHTPAQRIQEQAPERENRRRP